MDISEQGLFVFNTPASAHTGLQQANHFRLAVGLLFLKGNMVGGHGVATSPLLVAVCISYCLLFRITIDWPLFGRGCQSGNLSELRIGRSAHCEVVKSWLLLDFHVAHSLITMRDVQYMVRNDKALIINELTGRVEEKRRWPEGIHQGYICETGEQFRGSLVNPFSVRFLYTDSSPRGATCSCSDDDVLKKNPSPSKKLFEESEHI